MAESSNASDKRARHAKDEAHATKEDAHRRREASTKDAAQAAREDEKFLREHAEGLSRTAQRAKWIQRPGDGPDRDGQTLATRSIEVVKAWAEARKARPATTADGDPKRPRVLRLDFPDYDKSLQEISWQAWGRVFEERQLVFLYQETLSSGKQSNFFRLDSPEREDG